MRLTRHQTKKKKKVETGNLVIHVAHVKVTQIANEVTIAKAMTALAEAIVTDEEEAVTPLPRAVMTREMTDEAIVVARRVEVTRVIMSVTTTTGKALDVADLRSRDSPQ